MGSSDEITETVDEDQKDENIHKQKDFKEVIEKADELQEDYHQENKKRYSKDTMPRLNLGTWLTGITSGEVVDMHLEDETEDLILSVRSKEDTVNEVKVIDRDTEYTENNEIVRLLEYVGIQNGRIEELHGEEIPIYVDKYALPSNSLRKSRWRPYVPKSLGSIDKVRHNSDKLFRYLGYEGEFQGTVTAAGFLLVSMFWWFLVFSLVTSGAMVAGSLTASFGFVLSVITVLSVILTIYTPMILRVARIIREKYVEIRKIDKHR